MTLSKKSLFGYSTVNIARKDTQNNLSKNLSVLRNKAKPWRWLENGRYANEKRSSQSNLSLAG